MLLLSSIMPTPDYFVFANDNSPHRHLTTGSGFVCLIQGYTHVLGVFKVVIRKVFYQDQSRIAQNMSQEN